MILSMEGKLLSLKDRKTGIDRLNLSAPTDKEIAVHDPHFLKLSDYIVPWWDFRGPARFS
jgi:hypothetical protein